MKITHAFIALLAAASLAGLSLAQEPGSVIKLMKSVVIPESDIIFAVGKTAPRSDKEWGVIQQSAARLGEAAKSLSSQAPAANAAGWLKFSRAMGNAANRVSTAVKIKNVDAVQDAGDSLYETCEGCHRLYMKK